MAVVRRHEYKIFSDGIYVGLLPNVTSEFDYTQEMNTAATQTTIEVGQTLDTASEAVEYLETESGEVIYTENEIAITTEGAIPIIGDKDSGLLIANNNDVEVWEYSDDDINGVLVFSGYISKWRASVGKGENITLTVVSYGKDMDDYIVGDNSYAQQVAQTSTDDWYRIGNSSQWVGGINTVVRAIYQTISGHSFTLSKVQAYLSQGHNLLGIYPGTVTVTMSIYAGTPAVPGALLSTATTQVTSANPTAAIYDFILPDPIALSSGSTYFLQLEASDYANVHFQYNTNPYSGGNMYSRPVSGTLNSLTNDDIGFKLFSGIPATDLTFATTDPSTMVTAAQVLYASQGGVVTYTGASIDLTGDSLSYSFSMATFLEVVRKAQELAPADFYWYVDPATQIIFFKQTATTATHKFILGRHFTELEIESDIENIVNVVYFSGGPTAGVNLLKKYTDTASLGTNRLGMKKLVDNRVTVAATAQSLSEGYMDENSAEEFKSEIFISAETYDVDSINLGDTVGFRGVSIFVNSLVFQISKINRRLDGVGLTLGVLPIRAASYVEDIRRDLEKQQTLDNPSVPS